MEFIWQHWLNKDVEFSVYILRKNGGQARALFYPSKQLPSDIQVTTPFTFPFLKDNQVVLAKDKMGWWNPVGGHIDLGETWQKALQREAYEEAGVEISNIDLFGYVLVRQVDPGIAGYPPVSVLPMTHSQVRKYDQEWTRRETLERGVFSFEEAKKMFKLRDDNQQMSEVFDYLLADLRKEGHLPDL